MRETRRLFWAAVWLAIALVAVKASYLGVPAERTLTGAWDYLRDLAAISFVDVLFAAGVWACGRIALRISGDRRGPTQAVAVAVLAFSAVSCVYALASVFFFGVFGGFLTYPLLALVGDVRMLRSSVAAQVTRSTLLALAGLPLLYIALVIGTIRLTPASTGPWWRRRGIALALLVVWVIAGQRSFAREWTTRRDRQVAGNAQWVFVSSWWQAIAGDGAVRMAGSVHRRRPDGFRTGHAPRAGRAPAGRPASAERDPHRARIGRGPVGEPEPRPLRLDAEPQSRVGARPRVRQLLRAHRTQLELARLDSAVRPIPSSTSATSPRSTRDCRARRSRRCFTIAAIARRLSRRAIWTGPTGARSSIDAASAT